MAKLVFPGKARATNPTLRATLDQAQIMAAALERVRKVQNSPTLAQRCNRLSSWAALVRIGNGQLDENQIATQFSLTARFMGQLADEIGTVRMHTGTREQWRDFHQLEEQMRAARISLLSGAVDLLRHHPNPDAKGVKDALKKHETALEKLGPAGRARRRKTPGDGQQKLDL